MFVYTRKISTGLFFNYVINRKLACACPVVWSGLVVWYSYYRMQLICIQPQSIPSICYGNSSKQAAILAAWLTLNLYFLYTIVACCSLSVMLSMYVFQKAISNKPTTVTGLYYPEVIL